MKIDRLQSFVRDVSGDLAPRIGKYEIEREIGRGGMATVYEAWDPALERPVAIKVLREGNLERLRREAAAAARLRHPNIVTVHEVGPDFIVMDLVAGRTLAEAAPALPLAERLHAVETIARAVAFAHKQGVVHRDIKPQNILIDGDGRPVLMDFGLAKLGAGDDLTVTAVTGTPEYMAPEQVKGHAVGPAADIWALGVVLYEMATGHRPFAGKTPFEVYDRITGAEPAAVAGSLGALVQKAIQKKPERRYPDAAALADDLARCLRGEAVGPSWFRRVARRLVLPALAAALLATVGIAGHRLSQRFEQSATPDPWQEDMRRWRHDEEEATRALQRNPNAPGPLLARAMALIQLAGAHWYRGTPLPTFARAEEDASRAVAMTPGQPEPLLVRGKVRAALVTYKLKYGIDPLADCAAADADLTAAIDLPRARVWRASVRLNRARWRMKKGLDAREELEALEADLTPANDAGTLRQRARVRSYLGRFADADKDFADSLRLAPHEVWTWIWRSQARRDAGDHAAAERFLAEALRLDPRESEAWRARGDLRFDRARYAEAVADYQKALEFDSTLGPLLYDRVRETAERAGGTTGRAARFR